MESLAVMVDSPIWDVMIKALFLSFTVEELADSWWSMFGCGLLPRSTRVAKYDLVFNT